MSNKGRLILNFEKSVNIVFIKVHVPIKMDSFSYVLGMAREDCYMASIDLIDECYLVLIALCGLKYLLCNFKAIRYT